MAQQALSVLHNNALHLTAPLGAVVARLARGASCSLSLAPAPQVNAVFSGLSGRRA